MKRVSGGALTALVWMVAVGCGGSDSSALSPGTDVPGDGTQDGGPGSGPLPPPPTPVTGSPTVGIFVSSSKGDDAADATVNRPVKTLARALQLAVEKKDLAIYACAESYAEKVVLPVGERGITILGNYSCLGSEWTKVDTKAKISSPESPAVLADGVKPSRMEGFEVVAPDRTGALADGAVAESSYGMIVKGSDLTLAEIRIVAGKGQDGVDGVDLGTNETVNPSTQAGGKPRGQGQVCVLGAVLAFCNLGSLPASWSTASGGTTTCKVGSGGHGGDGGEGRVFKNGSAVAAAGPNYQYGEPWNATTETAAHGTNGANGARGAFGANGTWSFTSSGFVPADGTVGSNGAPGQGGGGGDAKTKFYEWQWVVTGAGSIKVETEMAAPTTNTWLTGTGGGGGAGGCGGLAGSAGRGGGASVGLFVVDSTVTMTNSTIVAALGGRGGSGAAGTAGLPGGTGTAATADFAGTAGGAGGAGGPGGQSGHGSVGPSIALVFHGTRPQTTNVDLKAGQAGEGGAQVVDGAQTLPAAERIAKQEHSF